MSWEKRQALLAVLEEFGNHYPDWRFGQLVSNVAGWVDDRDWTEVDDDLLQATARSHLDRRFGDSPPLSVATRDSASSSRRDLLNALTDLSRHFAEWRFVQLVSNVAALAHANVYDVEDDRLLEVARSNDPGLQWFHWYVNKYANESTLQEGREGESYRCPCCYFRTLGERGGFDVCPVCYWEDDGQDDADADTIRGGPNGALSLTQARQNFVACGACDPRFLEHVRPPRLEEK